MKMAKEKKKENEKAFSISSDDLTPKTGAIDENPPAEAVKLEDVVDFKQFDTEAPPEDAPYTGKKRGRKPGKRPAKQAEAVTVVLPPELARKVNVFLLNFAGVVMHRTVTPRDDELAMLDSCLCQIGNKYGAHLANLPEILYLGGFIMLIARSPKQDNTMKASNEQRQE